MNDTLSWIVLGDGEGIRGENKNRRTSITFSALEVLSPEIAKAFSHLLMSKDGDWRDYRS